MAQEFKPERLRELIRYGDRQLHPVFAGRDEIIDEIMTLARGIATRNANGLLQLITGAPGIGKTAMLYTLRDRCWSTLKKPVNGVRILPILISDSGDMSTDAIYHVIKEQIITAKDHIGYGLLRRLFRQSLGRLQGDSVMGTGINLRPRAAESRPRLPKGWTVMLMIDEIQLAAWDDSGAIARALVRLEGGSGGLPILPVMAGLSNSRAVLGKMGVSRLANIVVPPLPRLTPNQVVLSFRKFLNCYGISGTPDSQDLWTRTLWRWSQGWPKHLHNGFSALGKQLLATHGDLDSVAFWPVQREAVAMRTNYYDTRLEPWQANVRLMGRFMAGLGHKSHSQEDIMRHARKIWQESHDPLIPVPKWDDMLRLGLIDHTISKNLFACPIPSLHSFAVSKTAPPLHEWVMKGDIDHVRNELDSSCDVEATDAWGRTAMHVAAQDSWPRVITELHRAGASIQPLDQWGRTPLHLAAQANAEQGLATLVNEGADVNTTDAAGHTPLDYANRAGSDRARDMLMAAGARPHDSHDSHSTPRRQASRKTTSLHQLNQRPPNPDRNTVPDGGRRAENSGHVPHDENPVTSPPPDSGNPQANDSEVKRSVGEPAMPDPEAENNTSTSITDSSKANRPGP